MRLPSHATKGAIILIAVLSVAAVYGQITRELTRELTREVTREITGYAVTGGPSGDAYLQTGGADYFLRPGGADYYLRP